MAIQCLDKIQFFKVTELPTLGEPDSVYWLLEGGTVKQYVTDASGVLLSSPGFAETLTALNKVGSTVTYLDETGNTNIIQFADVAFTGDYNDLINTLTLTSQLTNDGDGVNNFATVDQLPGPSTALIGSSIEFDVTLAYVLKLLDQNTDLMASVEITPSNIKNLEDYQGLDVRYYTKTQLTEFFSGATAITGYNKANWDTAWGWGDHSTQGYLTSLSEEDPVFIASPAGGITLADIANWDLTYGWGDHSLAGYLTTFSEADPIFMASEAATISNIDTDNWTTAFDLRITGAAFNPSDGNLTITRPDDTDFITSFDGRYSLIGHVHPISDITALQVILDSKADLLDHNFSTAVLAGGILSINADPTKFDVTAATIKTVDIANEITNTNFVEQLAITPTFLLTSPATYIGYNELGIVQSDGPFNAEQRRTIAELGVIVHSNNTDINVVNNIQHYETQVYNQLIDYVEAAGLFINESGNKITPNGANLNLDKSAGVLYRPHINIDTNPEDPNHKSFGATSSLTFRYRLSDGTEFSDTTAVDPTIIDNNNGTTSVVGVDKYTIQRIYMATSGGIRIQPGQIEYDSISDAEAFLTTEVFITEDNLNDNFILRGFILVKKEAIDLSNIEESRLIDGPKNGNVHLTNIRDDIYRDKILNSGSTGLLSGGLLAVNADTTKFDISLGSGLIIDNVTDPLNPVLKEVHWPAQTAITVTNIATAPITYILIDVNDDIIQQTFFPTATQARNFVMIGALVHLDNLVITDTQSIPHIAYNTPLNTRDIAQAIGVINIEGNVYFPNGINLNMDKTSGTSFSYGGNYQSDPETPNTSVSPASSPVGFIYAYNDGVGGITFGTPTITIDPDNYNPAGAGTLVATPVNKWTVQRIYYFPSTDASFVVYGESFYATSSQARESIEQEIFAINVPGNVPIRAYLILKEGATDVSDPTEAIFLNAGKFGDTSVASTIATGTLQDSYNNSVVPQILTSVLGALTIQEGLNDANNVIEGKNLAGTTTFQITALGDVTGNAFITEGGLVTDFVKGDGSLDSSTYALDADVVHIAGVETVTGQKTFSATNTYVDGWLQMPVIAGANKAAGYSNLSFATGSNLRVVGSGLNSRYILDGSAITAERTYTLQDADGTLAFISDLTGGYLPLTGGTLTGPLTGTTITGSALYPVTTLVQNIGNSTNIWNGISARQTIFYSNTIAPDIQFKMDSGDWSWSFNTDGDRVTYTKYYTLDPTGVPTIATDLVDKAYADTLDGTGVYLPLAGGTMAGGINMGVQTITNSGAITSLAGVTGTSLIVSDGNVDMLLQTGGSPSRIRWTKQTISAWPNAPIGNELWMDDTGNLNWRFDDDAANIGASFAQSNTAIRTYTFPDVTGTVALTTDLTTDHTTLSNIGTNTHAQIDTFISTTVPNTYAVDADVVHIAGGETITGAKIFSTTLNTESIYPSTDATNVLGTDSFMWSRVMSDRHITKAADGEFWIIGPATNHLGFGKQVSSAGAFTADYTLNSTGTPASGTDLITKTYGDANYIDNEITYPGILTGSDAAASRNYDLSSYRKIDFSLSNTVHAVTFTNVTGEVGEPIVMNLTSTNVAGTTVTFDANTYDNTQTAAFSVFIAQNEERTFHFVVYSAANIWCTNYPVGAATVHDHLLAEGATDVTATAAEVNLLDLSGLTVGWALLADSASTASWQAIPAGATTLDALTDTTITGVAKGDMLVYNGSAWVDLTVGSNDTYLIADSTTGTGVKWGAAVGFVDLTSTQSIGGAKSFILATTFDSGLSSQTILNLGTYTNNFTSTSSAIFADASDRIAFKETVVNSNVESLAFDLASITGNRVVTWPDASGTVALSTGGTALENVVEDVTPQFAADLDMQTNSINNVNTIVFDNAANVNEMSLDWDGTNQFFQFTPTGAGEVLSYSYGADFWQIAASDIMTEANQSTISGNKVFGDGNLELSNVANTFGVFFTNTVTADRTYTLQDADGTVAFLSDVTGGTFTGSLADTQVAFGNTTADSIQGVAGFTFDADILTSPRLRLTATDDVGLASTLHAFQIGASTGGNLRIDNNEIIAANNGVATLLHIQKDGGSIEIGATTALTNFEVDTADFIVNGNNFLLNGGDSGDTALVIRADRDNVGEESHPSVRLRQDGDLLDWRIGVAKLDGDTTGDSNDLFITLLAGSITTQGIKFSPDNGVTSHNIHHAGNMGSGSGIDADTLRTFAPTTGTTANTVALRDVNGDLSALDMRATNIVYAGTGGGNTVPLRVIGNGTGTANIGYMAFYESNGTTRQGYFGFASSSHSDMRMFNDANGDYLLIDHADSISSLKWNYNATEYDIYHEGNYPLAVSGNWWGTTPRLAPISTSGVLEIGKYIDFHASTGSVADNDVRLNATAGALDLNGEFSCDELRIQGTGDVGVATTTHGFQIGSSTGENIRMDNNEIMAANNGVAGTLRVHRDGGTIIFGGATAVTMSVNAANSTFTLNDNVDLRFGNSGGEGIMYSNGTSIYLDMVADKDFFIRDVTTTRFTFDSSAGHLTATGDMTAVDFNLSSDERLKDNIRPLEYKPIDTKWSMWEWKEGGQTDIGLIAQEVEKTHPEFVKTEKNTGMKSVSYTKVLVAKMVEKDREIEDLTKRIERLENLLTIGVN